MIERLTGRCILKQGGAVVLDVGGVGYGVEMTEAGLGTVAEGDAPVSVWVHTYVREDAIRLFGFITHAERLLFNVLLSVSGVGPKLAMSIMSAIDARSLIDAVTRDDAACLEEVPGIGERQSKKLLLELKPKLAKLAALGLLVAVPARAAGAGAAAAPAGGARSGLAPQLLSDLRSALENFGYKDKELAPLLRRFEREVPATDLGNLLRMALADLAAAAVRDTSAQAAELF